MAHIQCAFFSETLQISTRVEVILPQATKSQIRMVGRSGLRRGHPVLYLLHGASDDQSIWMRRTSIERYASEKGLAIIMPFGARSYYTDMNQGHAYFTFFTEELPRLMCSFFPLSAKREETFVAGLSMGGYGALKMALTYPERFGAVASLSGVVDVTAWALRASKDDPFRQKEFLTIFGNPSTIRGSRHDLFTLSAKLKRSGKRIPKLYFCCGTEDFLYQDNLTFKAHLERIKIPFRYEEGPGQHQWDYWDQQIQRVLNWLPLKTA